MVTVTTVIAPARNHIAMQELNFRICRAILTLNHGAWYLDQRTRGNILDYLRHKSLNHKIFRKQKPHCYPKIYVGLP